MTPYEKLKEQLLDSPSLWMVTGAAGFIGSNLVEQLLRLRQRVIGLDDLSTGHKHNLAQVRAAVGPVLWKNFRWIEGDIRDAELCKRGLRGVDYVLHQAALGSVPRSIEEPILSNQANVDGFVNMLWAAKLNGAKRFVYATSSAVYGDLNQMPQSEANIGNCLSPYAVTKRINELYADVFARCYATQSVGLRYFNVFGPRQDPDGAYAAVIPKWIAAMLQGEPVHINGDGSTSRDFCFVANVVQANLLAATTQKKDAVNKVFNIAVGAQTSLNELFELLRKGLSKSNSSLAGIKPSYGEFRAGDVLHSRASIDLARGSLGYRPSHDLKQGLDEALEWYVQDFARQQKAAGKGLRPPPKAAKQTRS